MTLLKELAAGDQFYPASKTGKTPPIYEVLGPCLYNFTHGSSTRMCRNLKSKKEVSKSCRLEVVKTDTTT